MDFKQFAKRAEPVFSGVCWGALGVLAAYLMHALANPWLIANFGSGAPWWVYALLSLRLVGGLARMAENDAALHAEGPSLMQPDGAGTAGPKGAASIGNSDFLPN